jgi:hypothetical protein
MRYRQRPLQDREGQWELSEPSDQVIRISAAAGPPVSSFGSAIHTCQGLPPDRMSWSPDLMWIAEERPTSQNGTVLRNSA